MPPANLKPFKLEVSDEVLDDLRRRIASTRWPDQLHSPANDNWEYGTEMTYLKSLAQYWASPAFDWRAQERIFNSMPQFTCTIQDQTVHFVHQRCIHLDKPNAPALLICHGWPGSVFEFWKVLRPLAEHFHVVAPSIPGYGFSEAPHKRGFSTLRTAHIFHSLMLELGYKEFVAQGGDWGSVITMTIARVFSEHCKAIHINMPIAFPPEGFDKNSLSPEEKQGLQLTKEFRAYGTGYQEIQKTKPQTLSYGLNDSPVGLLAWIVEKFHAWSDCNGNVESVFTREEILTNVMLYWVSSTIGSSMRLYYETQATMPGTDQEHQKLWAMKIEIPTAVAMFPKEIISYTPKAWCENSFNLQQYSTFSSGGHFAALEKPVELVDDMKKFFFGKLNLAGTRSKL